MFASPVFERCDMNSNAGFHKFLSVFLSGFRARKVLLEHGEYSVKRKLARKVTKRWRNMWIHLPACSPGIGWVEVIAFVRMLEEERHILSCRAVLPHRRRRIEVSFSVSISRRCWLKVSSWSTRAISLFPSKLHLDGTAELLLMGNLGVSIDR